MPMIKKRKLPTNGMSTADGVSVLLEVVGESRSIQLLYQVHALSVQSLKKGHLACFKVFAIRLRMMKNQGFLFMRIV